MAGNTRLSTAARNAQLDALAPEADNGYLRIYDGAQPATPDTPISGQTLLAELRLNATAFGAAASGVITANAITDEASAPASGTAAWFRVLKSDGTTALWDGNVGLADENLVLNSLSINAGANVSVTSYTHTLPLQGT